MTSSKDNWALSIGDYVKMMGGSAMNERAQADHIAKIWSGIDRQQKLYPPKIHTHHEMGNSMGATMQWNAPTLSPWTNGPTKENTVSRPDRNKYDVHETFDAVLDTLNAAIENIANDLTAPGVSGIGQGGLNSIRASFDSLVDVRNEFMLQEYEFSTAKPEPVNEITPDENGIIRNKYGDVIGKLAGFGE